MSTLQLALAGAVVLLLVLWWTLRQRGSGRRGGGVPGAEPGRLDTVAGWPPSPTRLLSASERRAYALLARALPDHLILAQVPVSRFVSVSKRHSYADWLRRVGHQCVDLVVCDRTTQVMAVVELQAAEPGERAARRLERIARTLEAAGVPLVLWREDALPPPGTVRQAVVPGAGPLPPATIDTPALDDPSDDATVGGLPPRPSTWFDEMDSAAAPLETGRSTPPAAPRSHPRH